MRVYQSGGMRKIPRFGVDEARKVTEFLRHIGWEVVSPWEMDEQVYGPQMWDLWPEMPTGVTVDALLKRDFAEIANCQALVLMDSWVDSEGARAERRYAENLGLEIWRVHQLPVGYDLYQVHVTTESEIRGATNNEDITSSNFHDVGDITNVRWASDPSPAGEHRVTDPATGGSKGQKDCRLGALDPLALEQLGLVGGMGEEKYDRFNYLKGYKWSLGVDALYRHLLAFLAGEDRDEESGLPHMAHAAWHALCLTSFLVRDIGTDDRPV